MKLNKEITVTVSSVAYLCLHHGWSLRAQHLYGLKHVDDSLVPHPLQHDAQCDEHPRPAHTSTEKQAHIKVSTHQGQLNEQRKSSTHRHQLMSAQ